VKTHGIKPVVSDVFPLGRVGEAFERMEKGEQTGKLVLTF
jgi:D-arabinose 1-dehydrogenase-like Zn-dependent alcohol dehydrogenase